jgi:hypothetical protein
MLAILLADIWRVKFTRDRVSLSCGILLRRVIVLRQPEAA